MNKKIENINFKKVFIIYLIASLIIGISLCIFLGISYKDKIKFIYNYHNVSEQFEHNKTKSNYDTKLTNMANDSDSIKDILLLDKNNKIIKSYKNSEFSKLDVLVLNKVNSGEKNYFEIDNNQNVIFKLIKNKELMISTILSSKELDILSEHDDEVFFESEYEQKDINLLSYVANKTTGEKIYFISSVNQNVNNLLYLKLAASIAMFIFMFYWVLVALVVYQNALKLKLNPYLWGGITLITNIAGVILYLLYKNLGMTCDNCNTHQNKNNVYCSNCGSKLNNTCSKCNHLIKKGDNYCSNCGRKL